MKIATVIGSTKTGVSWKKWSAEKITKADFPMSRKRRSAFPLTRKWRWTVGSFDANGRSFSLLVARHVDVPEFQAVLAEALASDRRVLARWEFHGNHPVIGWHMHAVCGDVSSLEAGIVKPVGQKRIPQTHSPHRRQDYSFGSESMSDTLAMSIACERFGLPHTDDLLDQA